MECLTLNNLGCCMRRRGKMQDALQFLLHACALDETCEKKNCEL